MIRRWFDARRLFPNERRFMRGMLYSGKSESRRVHKAKQLFAVYGFTIGLILLFEWIIGFITFGSIVVEGGYPRAFGAVVAFMVVIVVLALHLKIANDGDTRVETGLKWLAGIGVFVFAIGVSMMFALVIWDNADSASAPEGAAGVTGIVGEDDIGLGNGESGYLSSLFRAFIAPIPPVILFFAMGFGLIISFYVVHTLIKKSKESFEVFFNVESRDEKIKVVCDEFDEVCDALALAKLEKNALVNKNPRDPKDAFSRMAYDTLLPHIVKKHRILDTHFSDDARKGFLAEIPLPAEAMPIPSNIKTHEDGKRTLAEAKDEIRPYAIMRALEAFPPRPEEEPHHDV